MSAVIDESTMAAIMQTINQSAHSRILSAPKVVLFDRQHAEVNDTIQRPFVTDFERVEANGKIHVKSNIQVFDEGTTIQLKASTLATSAGTIERLHLATELISKAIIDVRTDLVFGINDEPVSAQVPLQQIKSVVAAEELTAGQTLLIDPFVTRRVETKAEQGVPILSKLPYLARSFKNVGVATQDQQMMVLLTPSIEPEADQ